ncbi:hypothetical protein [Vibrio phage RYC]|nr:hypothetical protein [Vibrio phage RYC]
MINFRLKTVANRLSRQWTEMLENNIQPTLEYELKGEDCLIIGLAIHLENEGSQRIPFGVYFSGDFELETWFSGSVKKYDGIHYLPLDEHFDNLDYYLQTISEEITEGYLLPNGLLCD